MTSTVAGRYSSLRSEYKLVKPIAKGSQAAVKLWRHVTTSELFAIKSAGSTNSGALFQEAQVLAELHSHNVPGVVPFKGIYSDSDDLKDPNYMMKHLVLGYCDKGDLVDLLQAKRRRPHQRHFSEEEGCTILKSLVHTLKGCHALLITHRDIKLENIFLCSNPSNSHSQMQSSDYHVVLGDFGLAARFERAGILGLHDCEGTLEYMAPEVLHGMYDERADIWSLGVVLHCLLAGCFPFTDAAGDREAIKSKILYHHLDVFGSSPSYADLSYSARHLLSRMLDKNPMTRITLQEILRHAWVLSHSHADVECNNTIGVGPGRCKRLRSDDELSLQQATSSSSDRAAGCNRTREDTDDHSSAGCKRTREDTDDHSSPKNQAASPTKSMIKGLRLGNLFEVSTWKHIFNWQLLLLESLSVLLALSCKFS